MTVAPSPAPAHADGADPTATSPAPVAETGHGVAGGGDALGSDGALGSGGGLAGSHVDNLETLQMVQEDWPPCPWIPKSSLRRWSSKRSAHVQDCNFQVWNCIDSLTTSGSL